MTPVEIIALVFVVLSVIKLVVLSVSPKAWYGPSNPIVSLIWNKVSAAVLSLVIGAVVLFYLLAEISIVQVFATIVFAFLLAILTISPDIKKLFETLTTHLEKEKNFLSKYWLSAIVWIGLMIWVVWEIFS